jgi:hypothetical protein
MYYYDGGEGRMASEGNMSNRAVYCSGRRASPAVKKRLQARPCEKLLLLRGRWAFSLGDGVRVAAITILPGNEVLHTLPGDGVLEGAGVLHCTTQGLGDGVLDDVFVAVTTVLEGDRVAFKTALAFSPGVGVFDTVTTTLPGDGFFKGLGALYCFGWPQRVR